MNVVSIDKRRRRPHLFPIPGPWRHEGLCAEVDGDLWFPEKGQSARPAQRICRSGCPVIVECLRYALENEIPHGVWGGCSARERVRMLDAGQVAA